MKPRCLTMDRISSLPDNIIETVLCLVPIKDAVRTSILSKKWRYNWNQIPKLVFDEEDMFDVSTDKDHDEEEEEEYEEEEEEEEEEGEVDSERVEMIMTWKQENAERKELIRKCKHFKDVYRKSKIFNAIHQVLSMHNGVISEFTLSMNLDN